MPMVDLFNKPREWPVGVFSLAAFGVEFDISEVFRRTISVEEYVEGDLREKFQRHLLERADREKIDPQKLLVRRAGGMSGYMLVSFTGK